jgi:uncharacterized membrane protein YeiB
MFLAMWLGLVALRVAWLGQSWSVWWHQLGSGALLLFAFFMISDPMTIPADRRARIAYAVVVALVAYAVLIFGAKLWPVRAGAVAPNDWRAVLLNPRRLIFHAIDLSTEAMALACAALLLLAFQTQRGARLLAPLAATGRMALTTYLSQSVVCTFLFYSWGLGWFGRVGYTGMFAITLTLFGLQMAASTWWLKRYQFGPVEWVWRTLTYGRAPAMRVARVASPSG